MSQTGSVARQRVVSAVRTLIVPFLLLVLTCAILVVDWAIDDVFMTVLLTFPLMFAALLGRVRTTLALLFIADAFAILAGVVNDEWLSERHVLQATVVFVTSFVCMTAVLLLHSARKSALGMRLLAEVGDTADASQSLEQFAERLTDLLVPGLADAVSIDRYRNGEGEWLAAKATGPFGEDLERAMLRRNSLPQDWPVGSLAAVQLGRPNVIDPIAEPLLRAIASSDDDFEAVRTVRAGMFVPLIVQGEAIGSLTFINGKLRGGFSEAEVAFAETLADHVALGVHNADLTEKLSETGARLSTILAGMRGSVRVEREDGQIVFANEGAARLMRRESPDELLGEKGLAIYEEFTLADERGATLMVEKLPGRRVLAGEEHPPPLVYRRTWYDGEVQWLRAVASPLQMPNGERLAVSVTDDITDLKRAERVGRLLSDAGSVLLRAPDDPDGALRAVAELIVPDMADWCAIDLPTATGELEAIALTHRDPAKIAIARELRRLRPLHLDDERGHAEVIRSGETLVLHDVSDSELHARITDHKHLQLLEAVGLRSAIIAPVRAGSNVLGTISLVSSSEWRAFDDSDVWLVEELGRRVAVALEHARLYGLRSHIAATLQHSLVPPNPPELPGWDIACFYRPAGDGIEAGGDFYDVIPTQRGWTAFVGDVCGKGAEAASLTALCRFTLRSAARLGLTPGEALAHLNEALVEKEGLPLCTVVAVEFRKSGECSVANAGHPRALLIRDGAFTPIERAGPLLGLDGESGWPDERLVLDARETLVFYTDGVLDGVGVTGERFGEDRVTTALMAGAAAAQRLARLVEDIEAFQHGDQRDDAAVLVLERSGVREPQASDGARR